MLPAAGRQQREGPQPTSAVRTKLHAGREELFRDCGRTYANGEDHQSENAVDHEQSSIDFVDSAFRRTIDSYSAKKGNKRD
jgi:hypothetical protein